ncbi:MAG TPA: PilZ domain-containing protein [Sphingomicrobium sp.]|jgi:hypothetical protein|nr:PilZ domain-containing protein [Sphingomicrobium sp.]
MSGWKPQTVGITAEKRRRTRRRVLVPATVRSDSGRTSAIVRDVSSSGLLLEVNPLPATGSYVEVSHGGQSAVARVMWCGGRFAGVMFQDEVDVDRWVKGLREVRAPAAEIRLIRTPQKAYCDKGAEARHKGQRLQFLTLLFGACAAAGVVALTIYGLLSDVAEQVLKTAV